MNNDIVSGFDDEKDDSIKLRLQTIEDTEGVLIVYATGYVDTYNSNFFQKRIEKAIGAGFVRIVFEMSGVNYVSSTGWGSFIHFVKILKPHNGDIVLNQPQPKVFEVAQLLGLAQLFVVKDGLNESIAYFSETQKPTFPKVFSCPVCNKRLRASKAGRFRCSQCRTILVIDEATSVLLG